VTIKISRDDLAALAGTANETISRMLADFKDEKLLTKEGNAIRIFSVNRLKNIKQ
jgi:CRP-like cAMP-binding protein